MKKLLSFLNNVSIDGLYVPYSWHAPLNEASTAISTKPVQQPSRLSEPHSTVSRQAWA